MKRAARLLCVGVRGSGPGDPNFDRDVASCARVGVGAVILFDVDLQLQRTGEDATRNVCDPEQLRRLIAHLREQIGEHLLVCIDQEGGRVARLGSHNGFGDDPSAAEFALMTDVQQRAAARRQAQQLRSAGIDLNLAPCVDLTLDPDAAIIAAQARSFGADPQSVIRAATEILEAHRQAGVGACLKHFPGHGSVRGDSHAGAVDISGSWEADLELAPYRALCRRPGLAVMTGHLLHRGIDAERPASLSAPWTTGILRGELGFEGVVLCDSIDMRAVSDYHSPEQAAVLAVEAGADLVVDGFNLLDRDEHPAEGLTSALRDAIDEERIELSIRRLDALRGEIGAPA